MLGDPSTGHGRLPDPATEQAAGQWAAPRGREDQRVGLLDRRRSRGAPPADASPTAATGTAALGAGGLRLVTDGHVTAHLNGCAGDCDAGPQDVDADPGQASRLTPAQTSVGTNEQHGFVLVGQTTRVGRPDDARARLALVGLREADRRYRPPARSRHLGVLGVGQLCGLLGADGSEAEVGPGAAYVIEPGHDAWVVGDEPCRCPSTSRRCAHVRQARGDRVTGVILRRCSSPTSSTRRAPATRSAGLRLAGPRQRAQRPAPAS